ncbi:nitronate monooxygenase [Thalassobacillus cyri]|uniref:Probable nitronate monooxygenase n=1 Tax=Thalassobacillus cyri TaxID=571932 RepID=A0A1H4E5W7_9BACI|nr:nitronate monooxygenase [Thalassobacillus cyri]SEA80464.1 nitronate monooxygenase [Thalassobacillus cyri]
MFQTKITELFQIEYPIIQGGLQGLGTSPLVTAVSQAGGLGLITAGSYPDKKAMLSDIEQVRANTDKPFGVNIAIGIRRPMDEFVEGVIEGGVPIVFTSGANPEKYMKKLKQAGIKVVHVVPSLRFAKKAEKIGCDAVVALGYECGGHPGLNDTTSMVITPRIAKELSIPVIAAGGFSDGKGLLAALSLGAEGIQMGTRFLAVRENPIHDKIKNRLIELEATDTSIIKRSINKPARVMKTEVSKKINELENQGCTVEQLLPYIGGEAYKALIEKGDVNQGVISLGQVVDAIDSILPVSDLINEIVKEAKDELYRLNKLVVFSQKEGVFVDD